LGRRVILSDTGAIRLTLIGPEAPGSRSTSTSMSRPAASARFSKAQEREIDPKALEGEALVGFSEVALVLRMVVEGYLREKGVDLTPSHRIENFATGLSLVASIRGVALLPAYVEALLPWSVVSRPLKGEPPTIDLAVGYRSDNPSPVLKTFLAGLDQLIAAGPAGTRKAR
jgi:LysR family hca operon transcriptional activator